MRPRSFLLLALLALLYSPFLSAPASAQTPQRPNILFIFTDDHAAHAVSAYGSKVNKTPNMDRLAREGMLFQNCLVTYALCGPSRAAIQTGKYAHLNGFYINGDVFDGSQQTFPKLMQKSGYQTALVGKWHLESDPQGFDHWEVLVGQGTYYNPVFIQNGKRQRIEGYATDITTDRTIDWLNNRDTSKPFMLMCQHKAPHREWAPDPKHFEMFEGEDLPEPDNLFDDYAGRGRAAHEQDMTIEKTLTPRDLKLVAPNNLTPEQKKAWDDFYIPRNKELESGTLTGKDLVRAKYQRYMKDYLRCIASVDDNIGRLLEHLDKHNLTENTIVIYSSDNGFFLGDHGWFDKRFMYEESYRIPLLVRWPGVTKPGSVNSDLVSNIDFPETFLDAAGIEVPADMQGRSLVPLLKGDTPADWRKSHYYHYYEFLQNAPTPHMVKRHYGVRTDRYKLIHYYQIGEWELFDLQNDPREMKSVYNDPAYASTVAELTTEVNRLRAELKVPDDSQIGGHPDPVAGRRGQRAQRPNQQRQNQQRQNQQRQPANQT